MHMLMVTSFVTATVTTEGRGWRPLVEEQCYFSISVEEIYTGTKKPQGRCIHVSVEEDLDVYAEEQTEG